MLVDVIWGYEFWVGCFGWLESGWPPRMVCGERSRLQEKSLVEVDGSQCGATLKPIWAKLLQDDGEITFGGRARLEGFFNCCGELGRVYFVKIMG